MTNSEQYDLRPSENDLGENNGSQLTSEAEIFCRIMERLNAVALDQAKALLQIAVTAGEKLHSVSSADNTISSTDFPEHLINQVKAAGESNYQNLFESLKKTAAVAGEDDFRRMLEQAITLAVQNSVANQQALNQIGAAILSKATNLLLES